jgi:hypothetical protein
MLCTGNWSGRNRFIKKGSVLDTKKESHISGGGNSKQYKETGLQRQSIVFANML